MSTMSFSVEDNLKRDFKAWAKRAKKSDSALFRDMLTSYQFNQQLDKNIDKYNVVLDELGIQSETELYNYLESDESYQDRLRQQRLPGRQQTK